ncbi:hypothetical protein ENC_22320 [Enterobacter hormaechei]|nr:hypothetical protein ENC_22320 [Enterobacter hormaechei]
MTIRKTALATTIGAAVALASFASQAEITLLKQDPQAGNPLSRLNFTVGGSIRPQFQNMTGDDGKNSYKRNGFDGGTRFRFAADYYLFDDISWISYYELGGTFRRSSTGIITTPTARTTPLVVCSTPV